MCAERLRKKEIWWEIERNQQWGDCEGAKLQFVFEESEAVFGGKKQREKCKGEKVMHTNAKNLVATKKNYNEQLSKKSALFLWKKWLDIFANYLMPEYERTSISEYTGLGQEKFIFGSDNEKIKNLFGELVELELNEFLFDLF